MSHPVKLGKYPITGVIGKGSMGVVYQGFDPVIHRPVAIKTIHKNLLDQNLSGSSATARFQNEARAVGRLAHPGIVAIYEYGEDQDVAYIAMEYVEGRPLSQILAGSPRPPEGDVLTLMDQLLDALACAHRAGVWHRDIKPANLIVTHTGQLKVTDFGIARIESVMLTQVTSTIGTSGYMAPEQYIGDGVDQRVDLFAAGVLLYQMLTGNLPFIGTPESVMYKVLNEHPLPPSQVLEAQRADFYDAIIDKALAKAPEQRYVSATEFRAALARRRADGVEATEQTTVIVVRPGASIVKGGAPMATGAPSAAGSAGTPIPGWDAATLQRVELALASFVGPMAKVLVRQAARHCQDLAMLQASVSAHLPSEDERQRFIAKLGGGAVPSSAAPAGAPASGGSSAAQPPLSAELISAAQRVLASHIGPIASVVVKKVAAHAEGREHFHRLLGEQVAEGAERQRLLADLQKKA